jgi:hypothetical protein
VAGLKFHKASRPVLAALGFILAIGLRPPTSLAQPAEDATPVELVQLQGETLAERVQSDPDQFGGIFFEDGTYVVLVVDESSSIDSVVPTRYVHVKHSYRDLASVRDKIVSIVTGLNPVAVGFVSVGVDVPNNLVRLTVNSLAASLPSQVGNFGDMLAIDYAETGDVPLACNSRNDCLQLRGGLAIYRPVSGGYVQCSTGAQARKSGGVVMITAGHCDLQTSGAWYHFHTQGGTQWAGTSTANGLLNGKDTDVLQVSTTALSYSPYNRIYQDDLSKSRAIAGVTSNAGIYTGLAVRKSGTATNTTTGQVVGDRYLTFAIIDNWPYFHWVYPASFNASPGDSGSTVWRWHPSIANSAALVGIAVGKNSSGNTTFASQQDATGSLGLSHFCTNNGCN